MPTSSTAASERVPVWVRTLVLVQLAITLCFALPPPPESFLATIARPGEALRPRKLSAWLLWWNERYVRHSPLSSWVDVTGTWQRWNMFAPNPANLDFWVDAVATYADGSQQIVAYPRLAEMSQLDRIGHERFRKFIETAHKEEHAFLWPAIGDWLARRAPRHDGEAPVRIALRRHWREVAPPSLPQATEYQTFVFYEGAVDGPHRGRSEAPS